MAHDALPDLDELATELVQLRHRQRDLLSQYEKALERIAAFPNEFGRAQAASLAERLDEMAPEWNTSRRSFSRSVGTTNS